MASELVNLARNESKSKQNGFKTARNHFNKYLIYIKHPKASYDLLEKDEISEDLFGKFGDYLIKVRLIPKLNTALTYISLMKTYFNRLKKANLEDIFCSTLNSNVQKEYQEKAKETNTLLAEVADPVLEQDISIVNEVLFLAVNVTDRARKSRSLERCMHDRLLLCWDRGLVGRISEVAMLTTCTVTFYPKEYKLMVL